MSAVPDGPLDQGGPPDPTAPAGPGGGPTPAAGMRRRPDASNRGTATLPELRRSVENQILTGFSHRLWVTGQVDAPEHGPDGSLHFELVALDDETDWLRLPCDIGSESLPELRALLRRVSDADLDDVVASGRAARVGGLLRYDFRVHRLALAVSAVDPATTAQALAELRSEARERVRGSGLARHQRRLGVPVAPVRVALLGGADDPALEAAAARLRGSGYAVHLRVVPAVLTGAGASARVAEALAQVAGHVEIVLVVRSEGRELELAAFDGEDLARAVAATPVPVVVGLGGRGEWTVCDEVAAQSLATADAAVDVVLSRLADAEAALRHWRGAVRSEAEEGLGRGRAALEAAREAVEALAVEAAARAEEAARRRWRVLLAGSGAAAAVIVAAALAAGTPALLFALLLVAAVLAAGRWGTTGHDRRGSRPMALDEVSFAQVLERLERIRDELARTSSPEAVQSLHDEAQQLVSRGEQVLGRGLDGPAPQRSVAAGGGQADAGPPRAAEAAASAGADDTTTSVVLLPQEPDAPTGSVEQAGDRRSEQGDGPEEGLVTQRRPAGWAAGDAETTQVLPTQSGR